MPFALPRSAADHLADLRAVLTGRDFSDAELRGAAAWMAGWLKPHDAFRFCPDRPLPKTADVLSAYFAETNGVPPGTEIVANRQTPDEWRGSLGDLIAANADDPLDLPELTEALAYGRVYHGGGGAAAGFTVEAA